MKSTLDWNKYINDSLEISSEGIVMLENNGALPLKKGCTVSLFGRMQDHYIKSGTGSGGMVNVNHVVTIREALIKSPDIDIDEELAAIYDEFDKESPIDNGIGWGNEPWSQEEMPLTDDIVSKASSKTDTAVAIIARLAGEDRDNVNEKGAYQLTDKEEDMIARVCSSYEKSIVIINSGGLIDMSFVKKYKPSAVLYVWQGGMIGALSVPEILVGNKNPSGHLTDTIAENIEDYPSDKNFGKGDGERDNFEEDIYVGYRFFETFSKSKVLYPFGYGLSYTTFKIESKGVNFDHDVFVSLNVTNTGSVEGKCVAMVFVSAPQGVLGKPSRALCGFAKTKLLKPGESQDMTIKINLRDISSYDDSGKTTHPYSWIMEEGTYEFYVGENVRDAELAGSFDIDEPILVEQVSTACKPIDKFQRIIPTKDLQISYEDVPTREINAIDRRLADLPDEIQYRGDLGIRFEDVYNGKNTLDDFISQMTDEELCLIVKGEGMGSPKVTTGTAGAFAGVTEKMRSLGVPTCCCSDGPSGMRIDSGKCAMAIPNGTCIASTFNTELIEDLFTWFGLEMVSNEIDVILGPGINIHRHPLNGRNFEYFSEDPFLTGKVACAQLRGLHKNKVTGCIKHFCTNNREYKRHSMSSNVSERALREIYLRAFEMAVRDENATCVMSVYNRINGTYGSSNYETTTEILRHNWGFKGIVMSDWWANSNSVAYGVGDKKNHFECVRAQNDLYMCYPFVELRDLRDGNTYETLQKGDPKLLTRADLQRCAKNILGFALHTPAMDRVLGQGLEIEHIDSPFADDKVPVKADKYFEIKDGAVLDMTEYDTLHGHDAVFGLNVTQPGCYEFSFTASSDLNDLAQIPMTFFYTSIPISVITWNGSEGKDVSSKLLCFCSGQPAIIRLHFGAPGVTLKKINCKYIGAERPEEKWGFA
ncbi:MAG: glycoside hydrolase family 3 protein [Clostridiales bacterium]|nr:glycoside hydrolase family 3 protein [Clostridiales bacterium]